MKVLYFGPSRSRAVLTVGLTVVAFSGCATMDGVDAFLSPSRRTIGWLSPTRSFDSSSLHVSTDSGVVSKNPDKEDDDNDTMDDEKLLRMIPKSQLEDLCAQNQLATEGTKKVLLERLRTFADEQAELERQRRRDRIARVESGGEDGKERYEIVSDCPEDDDDEGYFYFQAATNDTSTTNATTTTQTPSKKKPSKPAYTRSSVITAPPPPDIEPNEKGERVVTVYSTTDQNDLTGIAGAQPGQAFTDNALMSGEGSTPSGAAAPWDMNQQKSQATTDELDEAKETVAELVHVLLTSTGAPAFREEFSEGLTALGLSQTSLSSSPEGFVGFDPSKVSTDVLTASSKALRANRGQVLQEVLRDYELRAVGHDGMAGDDKKKGGGHYREVSKVRAFLEGYRRAEVRRVARETTTMFLDKLVTEGVEGLDLMLASMTRSSDDTNDAGELNDSLLDFLNDSIRQQEKKVEQTVGIGDKLGQASGGPHVEVDKTAHLWNVTNEKGERIETLDPNDPAVRKALEEEASKSNGEITSSGVQTPETAPEQLLLLLCLLRDRIKAEAAFSNDEKGRNLRILAHCLHSVTDAEREQIIMKEMGSSLTRLESFSELVESSIEYAESASHQLQPSKGVLNVNMLKCILDLAEELREKQSWKAASVVPKQMQ